ncbi:hypothetical protein QTO34_017420 [Cnephaeus nilssonii]|uniref:DDE-1 domain-containing protein n=1 Tax=Cnephaeus nilssonii TaxID=3371016 RepID=A0AA40I119_CNENI|nr:hypothetical protein QTO34_017420 [Eptesicus nilssonii]
MPFRTFLAREKPVSGFKASKGRLTLLLGANVAGDFKMKPMIIYHSPNPRALKKKDSFRILLFIDNAPGHPRALRRCTRRLMLYSWNTTFILSAHESRSNFDFQVLLFKKQISALATAIVSDSSDGSGQRKLKTFWKGLTILYAIKNIVIYGKSQNININRSSEEVDSNTGVQDFSGGSNCRDGGKRKRARQLVEPEDLTELLQSRDKTNEELLLTDEQRKWYFEMESTPGEDAGKLLNEDLEYCIISVDNAVAGFERIDPILKELLWLICYQTASHAIEKSFVKGSQSINWHSHFGSRGLWCRDEPRTNHAQPDPKMAQKRHQETRSQRYESLKRVDPKFLRNMRFAKKQQEGPEEDAGQQRQGHERTVLRPSRPCQARRGQAQYLKGQQQ